MSVDLGAEKIIGAEKNQQKIAVEVKSFLGLSAIYEFHLALGQFLNYRIALRELEPERKLYLAVPNDTYATFFSLRLPQLVSKDLALTYIIYEPKKEVIEQWIS
jgi:XisH protein